MEDFHVNADTKPRRKFPLLVALRELTYPARKRVIVDHIHRYAEAPPELIRMLELIDDVEYLLPLEVLNALDSARKWARLRKEKL